MATSGDITKLLESWTHSQQQLWTGCMEAMQASGDAGGMQQNWQRGMKSWREAVEQTLDTQAKAMSAWAQQGAGMEGTSPQAKQLAANGAQVAEQWNAAQRGMWEQWFALMGKAMEGGTPPGADQLQQLMGGWDQVAKSMQDLQNSWASGLTPGKE